MKTAFIKSFARDLKKLAKDKNILDKIREIILEVEAAESIAMIGHRPAI
jgi:mRNA-degrading endonuclease YafQ of YafQ-DinJ toxin-antitoxin module